MVVKSGMVGAKLIALSHPVLKAMYPTTWPHQVLHAITAEAVDCATRRQFLDGLRSRMPVGATEGLEGCGCVVLFALTGAFALIAGVGSTL